MPRRSLLAGAIVGALLTAGLSAAASGPDEVLTDGLDLYERVAGAAASGDPRAQEQLAAIDAYLSDRGLGPTALSLPVARTDATVQGVVQLSVEESRAMADGRHQ